LADDLRVTGSGVARQPLPRAASAVNSDVVANARLLVRGGRYVAATQKCPPRGEGAVDLLCGDGDRVLAATSHDADVRAFDAAVNDGPMYEEGLEFLFLGWDGNYNQPVAGTGSTVWMLRAVGNGNIRFSMAWR
jgi:hypothetical protein